MAMPKQKPGRSKQDYRTPADFIVAVKWLLNITAFVHDFAADRYNAQAESYWTIKTDSLSVDPLTWALATIKNGRTEGSDWGWLNPPYSNIEPWAKRCAEMQMKAKGGQVAFLVPASVGSNWFLNYVHGRAMVFALNGRLAFMPEKPTWLYPKDCMLCLYSPNWEPGFDVWSWKQ